MSAAKPTASTRYGVVVANVSNGTTLPRVFDPTAACPQQEQQRELKKAQKEAAKAAKKAAVAGGGDPGAPNAAAPVSAARGMPDGAAPAASAATTAASPAEATVQFCSAMPPTVSHAACSLTQTKLTFAAGEVKFVDPVIFGRGEGGREVQHHLVVAGIKFRNTSVLRELSMRPCSGKRSHGVVSMLRLNKNSCSCPYGHRLSLVSSHPIT